MVFFFFFALLFALPFVDVSCHYELFFSDSGQNLFHPQKSNASVPINQTVLHPDVSEGSQTQCCRAFQYKLFLQMMLLEPMHQCVCFLLHCIFWTDQVGVSVQTKQSQFLLDQLHPSEQGLFLGDTLLCNFWAMAHTPVNQSCCFYWYGNHLR